MKNPYIKKCCKCGEEYRRSNNCKFICPVCKGGNYPRSYYRNKKIILERDNYKCQCCNTGNKSELIVHHIDCDKSNNSPSNLITLCGQCHMSLHGRFDKETLRKSNIYKLFPKKFRWGIFGKRPVLAPWIIKIKTIKKRKYFITKVGK